MHGARAVRVSLTHAAFQRQRFAVPAVQRLSRLAVLGDAPSQRIVGIGGDALSGGGTRHAVEGVPFEGVALSVVQALDEVAAVVVAVADAGVIL